MPRRPEPVVFVLPTGTDAASVRARVTAMEKLLERSFVIPGINRPVGLDAIVGLVPVVGDVIAARLLNGLAFLGLEHLCIRRNLGGFRFDAAYVAAGIDRSALADRRR